MEKIKWFIVGIAVFGLCVGLYVGLSVSPIVNSVVSLLFAFIGGSVVFLIKDRDDDELNKIGISVLSLSLSMILGAFVGMDLRGSDSLFGKEKIHLEIDLDSKKVIKIVKELSLNDAAEPENLCLLVKNFKDNSNYKISEGDLKEVMRLADPLVFSAMLNPDAKCFKGSDKSSRGSIELHSGPLE